LQTNKVMYCAGCLFYQGHLDNYSTCYLGGLGCTWFGKAFSVF